MSAPIAALADLSGLTVLERGWLSSNNILIHAAPGEAGAVLVDTGHIAHAEQTVALVRQALAQAGDAPLARIINTHLHSDHCGGNAAFGSVPISIPPGQADAVRAWDLRRLGHDDFGRRGRFHIDATLAPGEAFVAGGRRWQAIAAPGHDPHSILLWQAEGGLLISADALWEDGFGVIFPELVGESGFAEAAAVLDVIEALPVRCVIPGHGAPFNDVAAALARARSRLRGFVEQPARHARHAAKVMLKFQLMDRRRMARTELLGWAVRAPLMVHIWQRAGGPAAIDAWLAEQLDGLLRAGVLAAEGDLIVDA
jgi:glyoxylase-like metal-dependent hydrolase (beta-lactamase superfamily II)